MGRDWKKWAMDKGLQKWFRRDNFLILVLTGILLIIAGAKLTAVKSRILF